MARPPPRRHPGRWAFVTSPFSWTASRRSRMRISRFERAAWRSSGRWTTSARRACTSTIPTATCSRSTTSCPTPASCSGRAGAIETRPSSSSPDLRLAAAPLPEVGDGWKPLARHRIGDGVLQRARLTPLARGTRGGIGADLVDVPVDLEVVAVGVPELDRDLAAGPPPPLEDEGNAMLGEPRARPEHLVERPHLEREVVQAARVQLRGPAHEGDAVMIGIAAEKDHPARHHAIGIPVADLEAQHFGIEAQGRLEVGDVEHDMTDLSKLEGERCLRRIRHDRASCGRFAATSTLGRTRAGRQEPTRRGLGQWRIVVRYPNIGLQRDDLGPVLSLDIADW